MKTHVGTLAKTGERCPESGIWKVLEAPSFTVSINEGSLMPPFKGRSVSWEYRGED